MNNEKHQKLLIAIDKFIDGTDRSITSANTIEYLLSEIFPEDKRFEDAIVALASYRPGGGDYLYDEKSMTQILSEVRRLI